MATIPKQIKDRLKELKNSYSSLKVGKNELLKLNHFTNLQPLCSKINRDIKKDLKYY